MQTSSESSGIMFVVKRDGSKQELQFDKITQRNRKLAHDLNIDTISLSKSVINSLKNGMTTDEIDDLSCESSIFKSVYQPEYAVLASRIFCNNLHKKTESNYSNVMKQLHEYVNPITGKPNPLVSDQAYTFAIKYEQEISKCIDYNLDYNYTYFALKTLAGTYLLKCNNKVVERPQHLLMRVAIGMYGDFVHSLTDVFTEGNIEKVLECYREMSLHKYTHATPTLFSCGTPRPQLSSCFLTTADDSIESIGENIKDCMLISKNAGGIGVDISSIRGRGSYIAGTNGKSGGIVPFIKMYNETARAVDQSGKRKGAIMLNIQPWHPDVFEFLALKENLPPEELRARDIFPALWMPDLFYKRWLDKGMWSLFCPNEFPELITLYGKDFESRYCELESQQKYKKQIKIEKLWDAIYKSLTETGSPYILNKDQINNKNNQSNIGTITSSNLCCEILQYHDSNNISTCNLSSVCLPKFVNEDLTYNYEELGKTVEQVVENLNSVVDRCLLPVEKAIKANAEQRAIGIGVQGLNDVFAKMKISWESAEAIEVNKLIFETMYYYAIKKSSELGKIDGNYHYFSGSPISKGILQCDMWNIKPLSCKSNELHEKHMPTYDWNKLRDISSKNMRNSLLLALMPTGTTSGILNNSEAIEAISSNIYNRKSLSGEYLIVNQYLVKDLVKLNLYTKDIVDKIIEDNGSIQKIDEIPDNMKKLYKIVWEIPQKIVAVMSRDRSAFIDQTQSLNISMAHPGKNELASYLMFAYKLGLKTSLYYLRTKSAANPIKFNLMKESDPTQELKKNRTKNEETECLSCSS